MPMDNEDKIYVISVISLMAISLYFFANSNFILFSIFFGDLHFLYLYSLRK